MFTSAAGTRFLRKIPMRRAARTDSNHTDIVDGLRQIGCSVLSLAAVGKGVPDLLVARNGKTVLMEVKDGTKRPSKRRLTPDQEIFHVAWKGEIHVVESRFQAVGVVAGWFTKGTP